MLVMVFGISIDVKLLQPQKAPSSIAVTPPEIVTEVKPLQPEKAQSPMLVTLLGIVIDVKPVQARKALYPMVVYPSSISAVMTDILSNPSSFTILYVKTFSFTTYNILLPIVILFATTLESST